MNKHISKMLCLLLVLGLNWTGLFAIGDTFAYFNDIENSEQNTLAAGTLDFSAKGLGNFSPKLNSNNTAVKNILVGNQGSLDFKYLVKSDNFSGGLCDDLEIEAKIQGDVKYSGSLAGLLTGSLEIASSTPAKNWNFQISLIDGASLTGKFCEFDFVFMAWQTDMDNYDPDNGFSDIEIISAKVESISGGEPEINVVLNEILPNPEGWAYDFNFGQDSDVMPQGEWVELYNNSDYDFDLAGYYLTDADGNRIDVEGCRIETGNTVIPSKKFLVVYRKGGENCTSHSFSLNNDGDTVKLFNSAGVLIDSYTYTTNSDYCDIEPTPGDENTTDTFGSCSGVPPNKSYARIPDGIGDWVDPIPTPGKRNTLDEYEDTPRDEGCPLGGEEVVVEVEEIIEEAVYEDTPRDEGCPLGEEEIATTTEEIIEVKSEDAPRDEGCPLGGEEAVVGEDNENQDE